MYFFVCIFKKLPTTAIPVKMQFSNSVRLIKGATDMGSCCRKWCCHPHGGPHYSGVVEFRRAFLSLRSSFLLGKFQTSYWLNLVVWLFTFIMKNFPMGSNLLRIFNALIQI